jgi:hydroxymethylbilane synthase
LKNSKLKIGSRGSDLALWQAEFILERLKENGIPAEIKIIKTQGDQIQDLSFDKLEGKGFFTKEIEEALVKGEIDLAVHSHKDLPTENTKGLVIGAVSYREDPSEIILINKEAVDEHRKYGLKKNAQVGTSSNRRKSQLLAFCEDITIKDLRGNVPTRIQKLRDKKYDAIMLAAAGVERLGTDLSEFRVEKINPREFIPAPAQGVLALQIRETDEHLLTLLQKLNNPEVAEAIAVERKILNLFDGGCSLPLGVYCEKQEDEDGDFTYKVWASKSDGWNHFPVQIFLESNKTEQLAEKIVNKLNHPDPTTVFITRDPRRYDYFKKALNANQFKLHTHSLIEIRKIPIRKLEKTDWVFFASKNAVKYFFEQKPELGQVKFATVGKSTSDELRKFGQKAEFIGYSTDTRLTAKQFASVVGSKTVLFPQARGSMRSIQQQFTKPGQAIDLVVYETKKNGIADLEFGIQDVGIFVFTSPSNVEAFFEKYKITALQKVVAMGDATANALRKSGIKISAMPPSFDDIGLVQAVMSV